MTTEPRMNPGLRNQIGALNKRPARGTRDGQLYTSQFGVSAWDAEAALWRGGTGGSGLMFLVGPVGSGAPYNTFTDAIAAAVAAGGPQTVPYLSGTYAESFTVPANISLLPIAANHDTTTITGVITLNGAAGSQSIRGFRLVGGFLINAGTGSTALIELADIDATRSVASGLPAALVQIDSGWDVTLQNVTLDGAAANRGMDIGGVAKIKATGCTFKASGTHEPIRLTGGGTLSLAQPTIRGVSQISTVIAAVDITDAIITGADTAAINALAGSTLAIHGKFYCPNRTSNSPLFGAGTVTSVDPGTNIGTFHVADLPAGLTGSDGAQAFCDDLAGAPPNVQVPVYYGNGAWRRFTDNTVAA